MLCRGLRVLCGGAVSSLLFLSQGFLFCPGDVLVVLLFVHFSCSLSCWPFQYLLGLFCLGSGWILDLKFHEDYTEPPDAPQLFSVTRLPLSRPQPQLPSKVQSVSLLPSTVQPVSLLSSKVQHVSLLPSRVQTVSLLPSRVQTVSLLPSRVQP